MVTSVVGLFVKVNFGLVSVFLCGVIFVVRALARDKTAWLWFLIVGLQLALAWAMAAHFHTNLIAYVKSTLEIVRQYGDGMAWGPLPEWAPRGFGISHVMTCLIFWGFVVMALVIVLLGVVAIIWTIDCFVGFYLTLPSRRKANATRPSIVERQLHRGFWPRWKPAWC